MNSTDTITATVRSATVTDIPLIHQMISELAAYEQLAHEVVATPQHLEETLFGARAYAEVLIAEHEGFPAGFCLFFHNYSTFLAKPGLYIEDVFVRPDYRNQSIGKMLFAEVAHIARARNCGRIEWWVLDWNQPAIDFYERMGATPMNEWTVYRLTEDQF